MKLRDIGIIREDEVNSMDLNLNSRQRPEDDLYSIQSDEHRRKPVITLRHMNKLKRMKAAQREEQENRKVLLGLMYSTPTGEEEGPV